MKAGLNKASVVETKRNPNAFTDFKFRRDALQGTVMNDNIELELYFQSDLYCSVLYCIKFFYNAQSLSVIFKYYV